MRYSFIRPKKKPIINMFTRIWIVFSTFSLLMISLVFCYTYYEVHSLKSALHQKRAEFDHMVDDIANTKELIKKYTKQAKKANSIVNANTTLNISIRNLFKLVPPSIVFSDLFIYSDKLVIKGATPTKEAFITLLETPLKSVFVSSKTSFYLLDNGWYDFINVNSSYHAKNNDVKNKKK